MNEVFGGIFGEDIIKSKHKRKTGYKIFPHDLYNSGSRMLLLSVILFFGLGILLARLVSLTLVEGIRYKTLASENRIREVKVDAPRGIIYDRMGNILVRNTPVFKKSNTEIFFEKKPSSASGEFLEGIVRDYIYGSLFAHVVGFTGEVSEEEIKDQRSKIKNNEFDYKSGDIVGKTGIEKEYDKILRGIDGKELVEVDATGNKVRVMGRLSPKSGNNLNVTLDLKLQQVAFDALKDKKGAIVATIPETGEVLVLYSSPSFDPNNFIRGSNLDEILQNEEDRPLFNRVVSGTYPPGSTFKLITSVAALESGAINKDTEIEDTGVLTVGSFSFGNWYFSRYGRKEGMLNIVGAIRRSNDIFFYKIGELTGIDTIALWARKMGTEKVTGIDIEGEAKGVMPDSEWVKRVRDEDWYLGNTYHVAIGQGDILATPIQVNAWTNVIANNGRVCRPHLIKSQISNLKSQNECKDLGIKEETIDLVREGMRQACATGGTGWPLFNFKIPTACKTGTAEFGDPKDKTHAWFTVFAPVYNPQISITVLVEAGGEGSNVAAPIAKKMLEEWFAP